MFYSAPCSHTCIDLYIPLSVSYTHTHTHHSHTYIQHTTNRRKFNKFLICYCRVQETYKAETHSNLSFRIKISMDSVALK